MPKFHEAFIFLAEGSEPGVWSARESELSRTALVAVPDAGAAATVAEELLAGGLDLIELYGALGPTAAAAVIKATEGRVPVGLVGVEEEGPVSSRAVIFEAPGADPAEDRYVHEHAGRRMTIVAVPEASAVPEAARALVEEGVERFEVCGGLGPLPAAATIEAVGSAASVGSVMFGFESLPGAAGYRARFEEALGA